MVYEIEFNREQDKDDSILSELGELKTGELSSWYEVEIDSHDDMEKLWYRVNELKGDKFESFSMIISYDPPTIYFDKDV